MSVRPRVLGRRVLVKPLEAAEATASGIVMPEEIRSKETRGMVVAVGEAVADGRVEEGEVVVYADRGPSFYQRPLEVWIDNTETGNAERFVIVEIDDLLLVLDDVPSEVRT